MPADTPQRVLIYRLGSLGDTVVALPALHLVRRAFPAARRILLSNLPVHAKAPPAAAILEGSGLVDGYIDYRVTTRSLGELMRLRRQIRAFRPQLLVYLMAARSERLLRRDALFFRLCGIRRIVGLPRGGLALPLFDPAAAVWEHEAARLLRCLRPLGAIDLGDPSSWDMGLAPAEEQKGRALLAHFASMHFIACGPGTKMQAKDWGPENWRTLLTALAADIPGRGLVLVGSDQDAEVAASVSRNWPQPVANLCGRLSPRETAAVLKDAELFLGPDSGPMHLAAAYGVPCAIAYASRSRRGHWFPIGSGHQVVYHTLQCSLCNLEVCIENQKKCLTSISVEEMRSAAVRAWTYGQNRRNPDSPSSASRLAEQILLHGKQ